MKNRNSVIQQLQNFYTISQNEDSAFSEPSQAPAQADQMLWNVLNELLSHSQSFDDIQVVQRQQQGASEFKYIYFDNVQEALHQFIQTRTTDEQLLHDSNFISDRKMQIISNLEKILVNIKNIIPDEELSDQQKTAFSQYKKKQGTKFIQHFKKIFPGNKDIEKSPQLFLRRFLTHYYDHLNKIFEKLKEDPEIKTALFLKSKQTHGVVEHNLGSHQARRSQRMTMSATDEKAILEKERQKLKDLDLQVLKITIAVERVNYYSLGIILPRDSNLNQIPFFEDSKLHNQENANYDFQTCLMICSLIKNQIERLEQIERQLTPYINKRPNLNDRGRMTQAQGGTTSSSIAEKSVFFSRQTTTDARDLNEFREKFDTAESRQRVGEIYKEFADEPTMGSPAHLKVNLHIRLLTLSDQLKKFGYKLTFQLFKQAKQPQSLCQEIKSVTDTFLLTEINFAETLLKDELVMVLKVYKQGAVQPKTNQKIKSNSSEPMILSFLKAYSLINVSDLFMEFKMKDGKPMDPLEIVFFNFDQKFVLDLDYETILSEMRYNNFTGQVNHQITKEVNLKLQLSILALIDRNQLSLRLDQSKIIRQKHYWDKMVRNNEQKLPEKDPQVIYLQEMQNLNLLELQRLQKRAETMNELRVNIHSLQIKDKNQLKATQIFRIQCFLVEKASNSQVLKFVDYIYSEGRNNVKKFEESHQTQISTVSKKGVAQFRSEFFMKVPTPHKTRDLQNYKLVFFVYIANDSEKVHSQITEYMVEQEPNRYSFYPVHFTKIPLLQHNQMIGGINQELNLPLYKYTPKKYLQEQLDSPDTEQIQGALLSVSFVLNSQQYSANQFVNMIIEPTQQIQPNKLHKIVQHDITNNDLLIYFTRILYSLLHMYNTSSNVEESNEIFKSIITIFKRFQSEELLPYASLIENFENRWRGDQDSDRKLLQKLQQMLKSIPEQMNALFEKSVDEDVESKIQAIQFQLSHLPQILSLTCKLFTKDFSTKYAQIREQINTYFRPYLPQDLYQYRPELNEANIDISLTQICSKPSTVIIVLERDFEIMKQKYKAAQEKNQIVEAIGQEEDDEEVENENPFAEEEFEVVGRDSMRGGIQPRATFHNQASQQDVAQHNETQLNLLVQMIKDLKVYQIQFNDFIQQLILKINKILHQRKIFEGENQKLHDKISTAISKLKETEKLSPQQQQKAQTLQKEAGTILSEIHKEYLQMLSSFPNRCELRLVNYFKRRRELRQIFSQTLQQNLQVILNFITRDFLKQLFQEDLMLSEVHPILNRIVNSFVPDFDYCSNKYNSFYKLQVETIANNAFYTDSKNFDSIRTQQTNELDDKLKAAIQKQKQLREIEQHEIETQVKFKTQHLSDLLASEIFTLLPSNDPNIQTEEEEETIQEFMATRISKSVFNHLKQYKNQFKQTGTRVTQDKERDTTQSELYYLFTYKMQIFEKKFKDMLKSQKQIFKEQAQSIFTSTQNQIQMPQQHSNKQINFEMEEDFLGLGGSEQTFPQTAQVSTAQIKEQAEEYGEGNILTNSKTQNNQGRAYLQNYGKNQVTESMRIVDLGARRDFQNNRDRLNYLYEQFGNGTIERRMCFFLNEMEVQLKKYEELKGNSSLSNNELLSLKKQHISLFSVLSLQHLHGLTNEAFKKLYCNRPGCLDRLIKQVRITTSLWGFGFEEFFFNVKKLQVVEQFCKNVIDYLCMQETREMISEMSDKYTLRSIVSQIWVLQITLSTEQAQVLYEFVEKGSVLKFTDSIFQSYIEDFNKRLEQHNETQKTLWNYYKEIDDLILPDDSVDLYSGIQGKIMNILKPDIEDMNLKNISQEKLRKVLHNLALMFVQIDELTFKITRELNQRMFQQIERLIKEIIDYSSGASTEADLKTQYSKKREILDVFCETYKFEAAERLFSKDEQFVQAMNKRVEQVILIKKLYLNVIAFEKTPTQKGNLLAQLISYYQLMQILQENHLQVSFQSNINLKYKTMISNINQALLDQFEKERQRAIDDPDFICQKTPSQYQDQMKEVKAFMNVENYYTYKDALDRGLLSYNDNDMNIKQLESIIDSAVVLLVPQKDQIGGSSKPNQFFDKAIELLSDKRLYQEAKYDFTSVIKTLDNQIYHYEMYERFEERQIYCNYYRINFEAFLPEQAQELERQRFFVYRTPYGYNQEFIKSDLAVLLGTDKLMSSKECEVKPLQPLISEVRAKYDIRPGTEGLSDTPVEVNKMCPQKFKSYFRQNFKNQFYIEQCPSKEPAEFDEQYIITIYEVRKTFPTMTMIQEVINTKTIKVPRVRIELFAVRQIVNEIREVARKNQTSGQGGMDDAFARVDGNGVNEDQKTLDTILEKYVTNDDVGGGLPKMLDLFFSESKAEEFVDLDDNGMKREYFELFCEMEKWMTELKKVAELYNTVGRNQEKTNLANERLEERTKIIEKRKQKYKLQTLQEYF